MLLPPSGMVTINDSSSPMLLPGRLGMTELTTERRTYGQSRGMSELRDRLQAEKVRHVARHNIPGTARKNWRDVLGSTAYPESKDNGGQEPAVNARITGRHVR